MAGKYKGQAVIVTGGARGLGRLIALDFAKEGADVAIADLREGDLKNTAKEIEALGVECHAMIVDLSLRENCYKMIDEVEERFGKIDVLVNNAGVVWNRDVVDMEDEWIQKTIDVNLMAPVWATKKALKKMIERKSGTIVTISSIAGKVASPAMNIYSSSKFGLIGFFDALRHELRKAGTGVRVVVVCPGYMDTKMFVGAKIPLFVTNADPQITSTALMKALDTGKEEVFSPRVGYLAAIAAAIFTPRLNEKVLEFTGAHESFYTSKTVD
jgi:all-trans-retinol dehydrogenase (NAD+)